MKTGIVMEVNGGTAVVLMPDGTFKETGAKPSWQIGEVVPVSAPKGKSILFKAAAVAACLAVMLIAGFSVYGGFFRMDSVISIDINPSMELTLNRRGQVIGTKAYNRDAEELLNTLALKWKNYDDALADIMYTEKMQVYLTANDYLEMSVYSATNETDIRAYVNLLAAELTTAHPQMQVTCSGAGYGQVQQAHNNGMSTGKWRAFSELQQLDPKATVEEYQNSSIGEIHHRINECKGGGQGVQNRQGVSAQNGEGHHSIASSQPEEENENTNGGQHGHRHGQGG